MKIYKIVLVGAIALSGYLGYDNFINIDLTEIADDYVDLVIKIGKTLSPLLAPYLATRKRKDKKGVVKTLDEDLRDVAEHLGVSRAFVRGRLGIGDMRKKQNGTAHKRRSTDKSIHR